MKPLYSIPKYIEEFLIHHSIPSNDIAQVISVHKDRYITKHTSGELLAEITGNLRYQAQEAADFPTVGDWVQIVPFDAQNAVITKVLPRHSLLQRRAAGAAFNTQLIAANIDVCFIVMSVHQDHNMNRLERYMSLCAASGIETVLVLSKTDLVPSTKLAELKDRIHLRQSELTILETSIQAPESLMHLNELLQAGHTYSFVGSSGAGKSTLINALLGRSEVQTGAISSHTQKGTHTTTHRALFYTTNGSRIIDTPGMRALGLSEESGGLEQTFSDVFVLAQQCKFRNCSHTNEPGCAVLAAIEAETLSEEAYQHFLKLHKEQVHFSESLQERKQRDKSLSKQIKQVKRLRKHRKH